MKHQRSEVLLNGTPGIEENGSEKFAFDKQVMLSQLLANASTPSFHELYALGPNVSHSVKRRTHKCCVYVASSSKYCARLNSIQAFSEINRDVSFYCLFLYASHFVNVCIVKISDFVY